MAGAKKFGVNSFTVDGESWDVAEEPTFDVGVEEKESVEGPTGTVGYMVKRPPAYIEATLFYGSPQKPTDLQAKTDATVVINFVDGRQVTLRNAWFTGRADANAVTGKFKARFEAISGEIVS